ncbi:competence-like protein (plasmid) [Halobacterium salinarum NRC-1]|uniref:Beta-lactamase domain protein n=2 Tax=Halobacterium salinarum NRC-34001 TaxID=2886895 RepID=Q9HHK3_HALSA|nr:lamin tail domain-containing protein [Halobacterium salinarum]AAG20977.1 competence-like protein [Halobacterium salinarum NRC-1]CAP15206.1 beta-lactamase domain protein [Halobacterium salinarum R1]DAC79943.1 TPA_inf: beta-lactamase domain protein [Halobacterium salinarum NRC-1]
MSLRRLLAVFAVVGMVVIAGCAGGIDNGEPATSGVTEQATTTVATTETAAPTGELVVHQLNVGQGSSTLVVGPDGETLLIDTGDWTDDGEDVIAYLESQGVTRIDHLVTSHPDADHIGGHAAVIEHFETNGDGVGAVYDPGIASSSATYEEYLDAVEAHNVPLYRTQAGDSIPMSGATAQILAPPEGYLANEDRNENSIVVHVQFGASSFLLPGDGETASEEYLVDTYGDRLNSTVLVVGHHGSRSSTSAAFLEAVSPRVAVISSAYESQYGHPHEAVLERLAARSIPTYWTATHGTITFTSNGSAVTVATQQDAPTTATELRSGDPVEPGTGGGLVDRLVIPTAGSGTTPITDPDGTTEPAETTSTSTAGRLDLVEIHADAAGDDAENLNGEYITVEHTGASSLDLSGWTLADAAGHSYTIPEGTVLEPGDQLTIYTGSGTDTATELYWGQSSPVWNNGGDTISLRDATGTTVIEETY